MPVDTAPARAGAILLLCLALPATAAEAIDTEGPDFTDSPQVVPEGRFQLELSPGWSRERDAGTDLSTPMLLRYGVAKDWEVRLAPEGYLRGNGVQAWADTAIGLKWHAVDGAGAHPSMGWILHLTLPTGEAPVRGRGVRPSLHSTLSWDLPNDWDLGAMPGIEIDDDASGSRFAYGVFAIAAGKHLTEKFRVFGEFSGERLTTARHGGSIAEWDTGASYLFGTETLVGFRAAVGVNRRSPAHSLFLEIAHRF